MKIRLKAILSNHSNGERGLLCTDGEHDLFTPVGITRIKDIQSDISKLNNLEKKHDRHMPVTPSEKNETEMDRTYPLNARHKALKNNLHIHINRKTSKRIRGRQRARPTTA